MIIENKEISIPTVTISAAEIKHEITESYLKGIYKLEEFISGKIETIVEPESDVCEKIKHYIMWTCAKETNRVITNNQIDSTIFDEMFFEKSNYQYQEEINRAGLDGMKSLEKLLLTKCNLDTLVVSGEYKKLFIDFICNTCILAQYDYLMKCKGYLD